MFTRLKEKLPNKCLFNQPQRIIITIIFDTSAHRALNNRQIAIVSCWALVRPQDRKPSHSECKPVSSEQVSKVTLTARNKQQLWIREFQKDFSQIQAWPRASVSAVSRQTNCNANRGALRCTTLQHQHLILISDRTTRAARANKWHLMPPNSKGTLIEIFSFPQI